MCCCSGCLSDICLIIISVLCPPLPVWIRRGICSSDSLINIALCLLGYIPGLIHSWYIIAKYPPYTLEDTKVYYIYTNDLESQVPRDDRNCVHHHLHYSANQAISQEPSPTPTPATTYGAINEVQEGSSSNNNASNVAPPAYTEIDNKVQH